MVLTALFSFINYRVLRMPTTIGVMFIALVVSLGIVTLGWIGYRTVQLRPDSECRRF
jgi:CPA1 family monovalent cation:H+ antiporter